MHRRYHSEYANQLHQLLVSVSRHFYLRKDGMLKYQEKTMEVNINTCRKSSKDHLVYYIMRDHFSGNFVFRLATSNSLLPLAGFLYFAWSKDDGEKHFWGLPDSVFVPKTISSPQLFQGLEELDIIPLNPPSGFASGVRIVRDLEDHIAFELRRLVDRRVENIYFSLKDVIYKRLLDLSYGKENKVVVWENNLPPEHPRDVPGYEEFTRFFEPVPDEDTGLLLTGTGKRPSGAGAVGAGSNVLDTPVEAYQFSKDKLNRAQELVYDALETTDREKRIDFAYKALKTAPYCADAFNLLAAESKNPREQLRLYEKATRAAKFALGDLYFKKNSGHFWELIESRPYMRALQGLARCLWETGERRKAIEILQDMLRLNPNDNQSVRYTLAGRLLAENRNDECRELLAEYEDDFSCFLIYSKALLAFRTSGVGDEAGEFLNEALRRNKYVPPYLLGQKIIPFRMPDYYSPGDESEAIMYAVIGREAWRNTPGALEWLGVSLEP